MLLLLRILMLRNWRRGWRFWLWTRWDLVSAFTFIPLWRLLLKAVFFLSDFPFFGDQDNNSEIVNIVSAFLKLFPYEDKKESSTSKSETTPTKNRELLEIHWPFNTPSISTSSTTSTTRTSTTTRTPAEEKCDISPDGKVSKAPKMIRYHTSSVVQLRYRTWLLWVSCGPTWFNQTQPKFAN